MEVVPSELDHGAGVPLYYFEKQGGVDLPGLIITYGLLSYENIYFREGNPQGGSTSRFEDGDNCQRGGSFPSPEPGGCTGRIPSAGGQEYDDLLVKLLAGNQVDEILNIDKSLVEAAGECALRSIIMFLGGFLYGLKVSPEILSYEGPFGVGYMVASFNPESDPDGVRKTITSLARRSIEEFLERGGEMIAPMRTFRRS